MRVLGKCGGYDSDIIAAMAWAAGNHVDGVPDNPYPARIINMSLGAPPGDACPRSYQQIVDELVSEGVLVVVSAGNEGGPVDVPANCAGVAAVAGLRHVGTKVGFSSLGPEVALSAPAGNCVNTGAGQPCLFSIETTSNTGTTSPAQNTYTDQFNINVGTSFSAPIVAGIAGLMLAVNGNLTAGQLIARLQLGATTPFPAPAGLPACHIPASATDLQTNECACTTDTCGAGMANAHGAVLQALRPIAAVSAAGHRARRGRGRARWQRQRRRLRGQDRRLPVDAGGAGQRAGASRTPTRRTRASQPPRPRRSYQLLLTVTDDAGRTDTAPVVITATRATSSAPATAGGNACLTSVVFDVSAPPRNTPSGNSSGGGGGGVLDPTTLVLTLACRGLLARRALRQPFSGLEPLALRAPVVPGGDARLLQQFLRHFLRLLAPALRLQQLGVAHRGLGTGEGAGHDAVLLQRLAHIAFRLQRARVQQVAGG